MADLKDPNLCGCGHYAKDHGPKRLAAGADWIYMRSACSLCTCTEFQRLERCPTCDHLHDVRRPQDSKGFPHESRN